MAMCTSIHCSKSVHVRVVTSSYPSATKDHGANWWVKASECNQGSARLWVAVNKASFGRW